MLLVVDGGLRVLLIREVRDAPHGIIIAGITKSFIGGY